MSIRKELFQQLSNMQPSEDGWIVTTSTDLAGAMQRDPGTVSKMLGSLQSHGNVETRKNEEGRVVAVRVLKQPRAYGAGDRSLKVVRNRAKSDDRKSGGNTGRVFGQTMPTPNVDKYAKAKEAYENVVPSLGDYVIAEFKEHPLAEEALALKRHNTALISQLQQLRDLEREVNYLRKVNDDRLRDGLKQAGVLVEHGVG